MTEQASLASYIAAAVSVISGLTINEWGVIGGLTIALITCLANLWFNHKRLKILQGKTDK